MQANSAVTLASEAGAENHYDNVDLKKRES
jgi:hypothetical protein